MSLQRVLETARKTGLPVIVSDIAGREPMVILPLEQFEAMAGVGDVPSPSRHEPAVERVQKAEPRTVPIQSTSQSMDEIISDTLSSEMGKRIADVAAQLEAVTEKGGETEEFAMEERFYLEPIEDKQAE